MMFAGSTPKYSGLPSPLARSGCCHPGGYGQTDLSGHSLLNSARSRCLSLLSYYYCTIHRHPFSRRCQSPSSPAGGHGRFSFLPSFIPQLFQGRFDAYFARSLARSWSHAKDGRSAFSITDRPSRDPFLNKYIYTSHILPSTRPSP